MSSRRHFLKTLGRGAAVAALAPIPFDIFAAPANYALTILHTNDVHSHIDPFPANDTKYPGRGGVARRAAIIKKIRSEREHVLLLDAGDIYQGTPYFNLYGGELEFKLMSEMGYDASTIGNHDFDNGIDGLSSQLKHANFPMINANYDFRNSSMEGKTIPYKIFEKGELRIGVFGVGIELAGLVDKRMYGSTHYLDPMVKAAALSHFLKIKKKCHLVICLSHLGLKYESSKVSDVMLAKKSSNIDLIIGGHTHTFLDKPWRERNREGKEVLVTQAGWAGLSLGRIDYIIGKKSGEKIALGRSVEVSNYASEI